MLGYVITDTAQTTWVCKDKTNSYSLTTDKNKALIFDTKPAADTVFKFNLSKLLKSKGIEVKAVNLQIANNTEHTEPAPTTVAEPDMEIGSSKYIISVLSDAVSKLNQRYDNLSEHLSKYDHQRTDVEHYIELNAGKLNAYEGYQAYKLLQTVLIERRKVKDELQIICAVRDKIAFPEEVANIEARVQQLETRSYTPREFHYLFE